MPQAFVVVLSHKRVVCAARDIGFALGGRQAVKFKQIIVKRTRAVAHAAPQHIEKHKNAWLTRFFCNTRDIAPDARNIHAQHTLYGIYQRHFFTSRKSFSL